MIVAASDGLMRCSASGLKLSSAVKKVQAQALQQPFAQRALAHVDDVFEQAVDQDQQQENTRQRKQIG